VVHYLGSFDTKEEAALAHDKEARRCGKLVLLNFATMSEGEEAASAAMIEHAPKAKV
jgi:hypothetical protein